MPEPPAGRRVEREQRVREQVGAGPIATVEVGRGRAGRDEDDAPRGIDCHAGPGIGATSLLEGLARPGVVAEFGRPGNRVEGPTSCSRARIIRADVTRRRALFFADPRSPDEYVLVSHAGARRNEVRPSNVPAEPLPEIYPAPPRIAEAENGCAGLRVECVEAAIDGEEDSAVMTTLVHPVHDAAVDVRLGRTIRER